MSVLVIAEAGINHGGLLRDAQRLAFDAKNAGCDIVKFQTYRTDKLVRPGDSSYATLQAHELSTRDWLALIKYCEVIGIEFLTTPGELDSLKFAVNELGVKRIKIGSDDLTNRPLVEAAYQTGLPLILSTGMATPQEITDAVFDISNFNLLHCVSSYPCDPEYANLRTIPYLHNMFSCKVGYSDHTARFFVVEAAVAIGASIIEVHTKLDGTTPIDNAVSFGTRDLVELVKHIRDLEAALGVYGKPMQADERSNAALLRKGDDGLRGLAA